MADGRLHPKPQRLNTSATSQNKKNPSKFFQHFPLKPMIITVFLLVITFVLPSEPPDFVTPSVFLTKCWELFHLIFVGVAVSYGLFSRRNDECEGETLKFDTAQSFMSRLLQVTFPFDEVFHNSSGSHHVVVDDDDDSVNKMQTWSSQNIRTEPMLVVTENNSVIDQNSGLSGEKPLLLPVRSLKSRVSDEQDSDLVGREENFGVSMVYARSNTSPSLIGVSDDPKRSRDISGSVIREGYGVGNAYSRLNSCPSEKGYSIVLEGIGRRGGVKSRVEVSTGDNEVTRSLSRQNSNLSSRGFLSISRKQSSGGYSELDEGDMGEREERAEEIVVLPSPIPWRSRSGRMEMKGELCDSSLYSLPSSLEGSEAARLLKPQSSRSSPPSVSLPRKQLPSSTVSAEFQAKDAENFASRKSISSFHLPPPPPTTRRTRFGKSYSSGDEEQISSSNKDLKRSVRSEPKDIGWGSRDESGINTDARFQSKPSNGVDCTAIGKSVRTIRPSETRTKEIKATETEVPERKTSSCCPMSEAAFSEYPKDTRDFREQVWLESDDESETDSENYKIERVENTKAEERPSDVDKKADEFIAKFREQIRIQRIESIKKSTGQLK